MKTLKMDPKMVEKALPKAVKKQLLENAVKATEEYFFCNVGAEEYPKDIWAALKKAGTSFATSIPGVVVCEPYEYLSADMLLDRMDLYKFSCYCEMRDAIGVYLAGQTKERNK